MYPPGGGPPPPTLFCPGHGSRISLRGRTLGVCTSKIASILSIFSIFSIWSLFERISWRTIPKIHESPALEASKSSFGASKIKLGGLQDAILKRRLIEKRHGGGPGFEFCDFEATWLRVGGPRGFQLKAKSLKSRS